MINIKIEGLQDLDKRLREFGPKVAANGLRAASFAGARVIREAIKATAPVKTGLLRSNIAAFKRQTPRNVARYSIGVKGIRRKYANTRFNVRKGRVGKKYQADGPAFYAKFQEYGSSKQAARPFMRPAFINNAQAAVNAIKDRLAKAIELAARK